jgi:hypothetical protein
MSQVLANAVVNTIRPATPLALGLFKVEVWGIAPFDYVRTYEIETKNDSLAAQEGINRFVAEMDTLPPAEG